MKYCKNKTKNCSIVSASQYNGEVLKLLWVTDTLNHFLKALDFFCLDLYKKHTKMIKIGYNEQIWSQNVCRQKTAFYNSNIQRMPVNNKFNTELTNLCNILTRAFLLLHNN